MVASSARRSLKCFATHQKNAIDPAMECDPRRRGLAVAAVRAKNLSPDNPVASGAWLARCW